MNRTLLSCLAALVAGAVTGCAMLPMAGLTLAAQAAQGVVAVSLGPLTDMQERSATDRCMVSTAQGFTVSESLERTTPTDEGKSRTFEPALWRPEFTRDGYPQVEQFRTPTEGVLVITERSVSFVPPLGSTSIRIPYQLVQDVEVRTDAVSGEPRTMIVKSCHGRFDIVAFPQASKLDAAPTTEAAAELKSRLAAFRAAANN